jgi:hypothetical protein
MFIVVRKQYGPVVPKLPELVSVLKVLLGVHGSLPLTTASHLLAVLHV